MDEPPILSSDQTGVVEEQEGCSVCVCVCVYVWSRKDKRSGAGFGTRRRRVMGSFAMVGTVMGTGEASMPACRCAFVSICLSVSVPLSQSASKPQDGSNLEKLGQPQIKQSCREQRQEGRGGRRE